MSKETPLIWGLHCFTPRGKPYGAKPVNDKVYVVCVDMIGTQFHVNCWCGKRTVSRLNMSSKGSTFKLSTAKEKALKIVQEQLGSGYVDVSGNTYSKDVPPGYRITLEQLKQMIDISRTVGLSQPTAPSLVVVSSVTKVGPADPDRPATRANRSIEL